MRAVHNSCDRPRGSAPCAATTVRRPLSHRTPVTGATSATATAEVENPQRPPPAWRKQGCHEMQCCDRGLPPSVMPSRSWRRMSLFGAYLILFKLLRPPRRLEFTFADQFTFHAGKF